MRLLFVVCTLSLVSLAAVGCRVPTDARSAAARQSVDPGAGSFAFFSGLRAFFVDDAPGKDSRGVKDRDLDAQGTAGTAAVITRTEVSIR
jgi:hypothetical protein